VDVREDDFVEVAYDGIHGVQDTAKLEVRTGKHLYIDPRPDTVFRTSSPSYKAGQVLMLVHEKRLVDAVVEHWFGLHHGSRHRVRFGAKGQGSVGGKAAGAKKGAGKNMIELDLNEQNHAKLLFSSVLKYENARSQLLEVLQAEYTSIDDEIVKQTLRAADQRLYLREKKVTAAVSATIQEGGEESGEAVLAAPPPQTARPSSPPPGSEESTSFNALTRIRDLITPASEATDATRAPLFVHTKSTAEQDLLQAQTLWTLSDTLLSDVARLGAKSDRRHVPVPFKLSKLAELMDDEMKRTNPRDMILKSIEASCPKKASADMGEVLKQAIELHALVIIADVRTEAEMNVLKSEAIVEELLSNQILIIAAEEVVEKVGMPPVLLEACTMLEVYRWGCFMNDARLNNISAKQLLMQMRPAPGGMPTHYVRISSLHLSSATLGKDVQNELVDILKSDTCPLRLLDVSNTAFDGAALARALEVNSSLRSLDVRRVTGMADSLENIGSILLKPESKSNLAYFRSDAFQVLEGETVISLRERPMVKGAMLVLSGLLRRNRDVQELDLAATGLRLDWVVALIEVLANNLQSAVTTVYMPFNPLLESGQATLVSAAEKSSLKITMHF